MTRKDGARSAFFRFINEIRTCQSRCRRSPRSSGKSGKPREGSPGTAPCGSLGDHDYPTLRAVSLRLRCRSSRGPRSRRDRPQRDTVLADRGRTTSAGCWQYEGTRFAIIVRFAAGAQNAMFGAESTLVVFIGVSSPTYVLRSGTWHGRAAFQRHHLTAIIGSYGKVRRIADDALAHRPKGDRSRSILAIRVCLCMSRTRWRVFIVDADGLWRNACAIAVCATTAVRLPCGVRTSPGGLMTPSRLAMSAAPSPRAMPSGGLCRAKHGRHRPPDRRSTVRSRRSRRIVLFGTRFLREQGTTADTRMPEMERIHVPAEIASFNRNKSSA